MLICVLLGDLVPIFERCVFNDATCLWLNGHKFEFILLSHVGELVLHNVKWNQIQWRHPAHLSWLYKIWVYSEVYSLLNLCFCWWWRWYADSKIDRSMVSFNDFLGLFACQSLHTGLFTISRAVYNTKISDLISDRIKIDGNNSDK